VKIYYIAAISSTVGARVGQWYEKLLTSDYGSCWDE